MSDDIGEAPAAYVRRSTDDQDDQHQIDDVTEWLERRGLSHGEVSWYLEGSASGAKRDRETFTNLLEAVEEGEVTDVVVWEISRIARKGAIAQEFFDICEDAEVTIHITNGSVRMVKPDGTGRLVADIVSSVAAEERRALIRRTESGIRRARESGKWVGQVPAGFARDGDGYLRPLLNPPDGEVGYLEMCEALREIESGASYRETARQTPGVTRRTLSNIYTDDERRRWYLEREADDDRVADALEDVDVQ